MSRNRSRQGSQAPCPQQQQQQQQQQQGNVRLCHICRLPGHIATDCPQKANNGNYQNQNQQQRNNNNQQQQQRQNGQQQQDNRRNNNNNGNAGDRMDVDNGPDGACNIHKPKANGQSHTNRECTTPRNPYHPQHQAQGQNSGNANANKNGNGNNNSDSQQQKNTSNSHPKIDYCPRCNRQNPGHTMQFCDEEKPLSTMLTCTLCHLDGHPRDECRNPEYCSNCGNKGHYRTQCNKPPTAASLLAGPATVRVAAPQPVQQSTESGSQQVVCTSVGFVPHPANTNCNHIFPFRRGGLQTWTAWGPHQQQQCLQQPNPSASGQLALDAQAAQELVEMRAERASARRARIAEKCEISWRMYHQYHFNEYINQLFALVYKSMESPSRPHVRAEIAAQLTDEDKQVIQQLVDDGKLFDAAALVNSGWNFIRDPRALDSVARENVPVCHRCQQEGDVVDGGFYELGRGTDVCGVSDWKNWGVSVRFKCQCCLEAGYAWLTGYDRMVCE